MEDLFSVMLDRYGPPGLLILVALLLFWGYGKIKLKEEENKVETRKKRDDQKLLDEAEADELEKQERTQDYEMREEVKGNARWLRVRVDVLEKAAIAKETETSGLLNDLRTQISQQAQAISDKNELLRQARETLTEKEIVISTLRGSEESEEQQRATTTWAQDQYNKLKEMFDNQAAEMRTLQDRLSECQAALADANAALLLMDGDITNGKRNSE